MADKVHKQGMPHSDMHHNKATLFNNNRTRPYTTITCPYTTITSVYYSHVVNMADTRAGTKKGKAGGQEKKRRFRQPPRWKQEMREIDEQVEQYQAIKQSEIQTFADLPCTLSPHSSWTKELWLCYFY